MAERRHWSRSARARIFEAADGICHICGGRIQVGEAWDLEHVTPLSMGGADEESNLRPAHAKCHRDKTSSEAPILAKAKSREAKHLGFKAPSRNPIPGSRDTPWKRRMDGTVERRG